MLLSMLFAMKRTWNEEGAERGICPLRRSCLVGSTSRYYESDRIGKEQGRQGSFSLHSAAKEIIKNRLQQKIDFG